MIRRWLNNLRWRTIPATPAARISIWLYATMAIAQGVTITCGGPARWSGDFYKVPRTVPDSPYSWAVVIFAAGFTTIAGSLLRRCLIRNIGLVTIIVWCASFGITGATSAQLNPTVGTTAPPTYLAVSAAVVVLLFIDERRPPHDQPPDPPGTEKPARTGRVHRDLPVQRRHRGRGTAPPRVPR